MKNLEPRAVKPEEAFKILGIGRNNGYKLIKEGKIRTVKLGRRILVPIAAIEELLKPQN